MDENLILKPGWLARQAIAVNKEVEKWPAWMRREAGFKAVIKPKIYRQGKRWECQLEYLDGSRAFWKFETWWQAMSCGLILAEGQVPWMFPVQYFRSQATDGIERGAG